MSTNGSAITLALMLGLASCTSKVGSTASKTPFETRPVESYPFIAITLESSQTGAIFRFHSCDPGMSQAGVRVVYLTRPDPNDPDGAGSLVCRLEPEPNEPERMLGEAWQLGTLPPGFRRPGCAESLAPGVYGMRVSGAGAGGGRFQVHPDGTFTWLTPLPC